MNLLLTLHIWWSISMHAPVSFSWKCSFQLWKWISCCIPLCLAMVASHVFSIASWSKEQTVVIRSQASCRALTLIVAVLALLVLWREIYYISHHGASWGTWLREIDMACSDNLVAGDGGDWTIRSTPPNTAGSWVAIGIRTISMHLVAFEGRPG